MKPNQLLQWLKKATSVLLLCCFFIPLSKCSIKMTEQGKITPQDTNYYGYGLASAAVTDIDNGKMSGASSLIATLAVFFLPMICLAFSEKWQAWLHVVGALAAQYWLYLFTFFYDGIRIGGALAIGSWAALFVIGCTNLWPRKRASR